MKRPCLTTLLQGRVVQFSPAVFLAAGDSDKDDICTFVWALQSYARRCLEAVLGREDVRAVHSQVLQDVLRRIDKAFRYDSFTYPQAGFKLSGRLSLSKICDIKIKLHRPIKGQIKTLTIRRENGMWYACFSCVVEPEPLPANNKAVGLDVGLLSFVMRSDGTEIGNPRLFRKAQKHLRRAQRRVARRHKFSKRWKKAVRSVAKIHRKAFDQRNDFQHKLSRKIVNNYGITFVEDLNVKGLSRGLFAKSVHDAGWAAFFHKLSYKAASAGRLFLRVDPRGTSQRCPGGAPNPKRLSDREHVCLHCGLITTRDHASAMEILRLGLSLQPLTAAQAAVD